jgi:hypothetical protein
LLYGFFGVWLEQQKIPAKKTKESMGEPQQNISNEFELLDIQEYRKRMKVSRTTVFNWISTGALIPGRHFIKQVRVLRFLWSLQLVQEVHDAKDRQERKVDNEKNEKNKMNKTKPKSTKFPEKRKPRSPRSGKTAANLNY